MLCPLNAVSFLVILQSLTTTTNSVRTPPEIWNVHTSLHGNMLRNCSFHTRIESIILPLFTINERSSQLICINVETATCQQRKTGASS